MIAVAAGQRDSPHNPRAGRSLLAALASLRSSVRRSSGASDGSVRRGRQSRGPSAPVRRCRPLASVCSSAGRFADHARRVSGWGGDRDRSDPPSARFAVVRAPRTGGAAMGSVGRVGRDVRRGIARVRTHATRPATTPTPHNAQGGGGRAVHWERSIRARAPMASVYPCVFVAQASSLCPPAGSRCHGEHGQRSTAAHATRTSAAGTGETRWRSVSHRASSDGTILPADSDRS